MKKVVVLLLVVLLMLGGCKKDKEVEPKKEEVNKISYDFKYDGKTYKLVRNVEVVDITL